MASAMIPNHLPLLLLLVVSPVSMRAAAGACAGEKFPSGRTYATCEDLPHLGAALHWTYDDATSSLSVAFVAAPSGPGGWVSWGLNPTGKGMKGTQALVALQSSSAPVVKTYNITSYAAFGAASTPITFPATGLAADSGTGGKIRLYGKLQLSKAMMKTVNQVWQVGSSVSGGAPGKHSMAASNLAAMSTLVLAGPSTAPNGVSSGPSSSYGSNGEGDGNGDGQADDDATTTTSTGTSDGVSAMALLALALVGFLAGV